jgi:hypothetical protein
VLNREQLRDALDRTNAADGACFAALAGGASFRASDDTALRDNLLTIYERRRDHLERLGARTVGSDDFIERLSVADERLRSASVDDEDWHFVVFVNEGGQVVSTWGVEARAADPLADD